VRNGLPNEIIKGRLYLGNEKQARSEGVINALKITHIVNATKTIPNAFESNGVSYIRVHVEDSNVAPLCLHFYHVYEFVKDAIEV
jgi:hypothetical protein